jgi:hypothetical protein
MTHNSGQTTGQITTASQGLLYSTISDTTDANIHVRGNAIITGTLSVGGQNITGTTADPVYVPDLVIRKVAAIPSGSTDLTVGEAGSITWDDTHLYFRTSTQWLRLSGLTF